MVNILWVCSATALHINSHDGISSCAITFSVHASLHVAQYMYIFLLVATQRYYFYNITNKKIDA